MTDKKEKKKVEVEQSFRKAEGIATAVGVQNKVPYIIIDGKRINLEENKIVKIEVEE